MYKDKYLADFIERLNSFNVIIITPFLDLYKNDWFTEISEMLNEEIRHNISLIPSKDDFEYLEMVKYSIKKNVIQYDTSLILNKWIEKYDLSKYNFPFIDHKVVEEILATSVKQNNLDYNIKGIAKNMQIDFYCYTAMIEVQKIISFIDEFLMDALVVEPPVKISGEGEFYPKIFKDKNAFNIFKALMTEFGNTGQNLANYSFIYHKMTYDGLIHSDIKQQAYYDFLGKFDISIDKIKSIGEIGKISFRESIYSTAKEIVP
jgi:hypothetical protein